MGRFHMKTIENILTVEDAARILKKKGIAFERKASVRLANPTAIGETNMKRAIVYFIDGNCDVAFYLPVAGALLIQDAPRLWSRENFAQLETI